MIKIGIAYPDEPRYAEIRRFAQDEYKRTLDSITTASADVFAFALHGDDLIGCIGLYCGSTRSELFFEMCTPRKPYERLAGTPNPDRTLLGEIGTRVIVLPPHDVGGMRSVDVSIALTAAIVMVAHESGIRYIGFVTNRLVHFVTEPLGFVLIQLGKPDFSHKDQAFQDNMRGFLRTKQFCAGFEITSLTKCRNVLRQYTACFNNAALSERNEA
jgi:hypothetical protein